MTAQVDIARGNVFFSQLLSVFRAGQQQQYKMENKNTKIPSFWVGLRNSSLIFAALLSVAIALGNSFIW